MVRPLITTDELQAALAERIPPVVLDVRWALGGAPGIEDFRRGHLPSACFVDLDSELAGAPGVQGRHPLPDADVFEEAMRRCGVNRDSAVVVYDAATGMSAARAWWLLRWFGHAGVRLLDGGYRAWTAEGRSVTAEETLPERGDFVARPGAMAVVDAAGAARIAREGALLDARAAERYRGEVEPVDPVAGHIPGALSVPTAASNAEDGRFLGDADLKRRFAAAGVDATHPVAAYCGSGVTAAHEVLALELAGIEAALYPGSWSEWVADRTRPVATGADPG